MAQRLFKLTKEQAMQNQSMTWPEHYYQATARTRPSYSLSAYDLYIRGATDMYGKPTA